MYYGKTQEWEELHSLGTARFCKIINRTILFLVQKLAGLWVGPTNIYGSNKRVNLQHRPTCKHSDPWYVEH